MVQLACLEDKEVLPTSIAFALCFVTSTMLPRGRPAIRRPARNSAPGPQASAPGPRPALAPGPEPAPALGQNNDLF